MASTNKTENYALNQWVKTDPVLMADMNADNAKIDAALSSIAAGMVKIAYGSYVGDDTYGAANPCSLSFDFVPKLVIISGSGVGYGSAVLVSGTTEYNTHWGANGCDLRITWSGSGLSWYAESPEGQLNSRLQTYRYFVFG